jgi:hypothetical protein
VVQIQTHHSHHTLQQVAAVQVQQVGQQLIIQLLAQAVLEEIWALSLALLTEYLVGLQVAVAVQHIQRQLHLELVVRVAEEQVQLQPLELLVQPILVEAADDIWIFLVR